MEQKVINKHLIMISIDGLAAYYLQDPRVKMPHLRKMISQGVVAERMESIFPTATWAIHTSLVTGAYPHTHGVLGNWVVDRRTRSVGEFFGDRMYNKEDVVAVETLYDIAKKNGWSTASICWPVTRGAVSIDYNIPEFYEQELFEAHCTASLWNELQQAGIPVGMYGPWSKDHARGHMQDALTTEIAKHLIQHHQPNLLMIHYLLPDSYQHDHGTRSDEVYWSLAYIDQQIGEVIQSIAEAGLEQSTDIVVTSDHGFLDTIKTFYPNSLFRQQGWLDPAQPKAAKVLAVSNGGAAFVYVLEEDSAERMKLLDQVRHTLQGCEGVGEWFEADQFAKLHLPFASGKFDHYVPDFIFEAELDCFIHFDPTADQIIEKLTKFKGMHGYLPEREEMQAIFVAAGPSIKSAEVLERINLIDVAPTLVQLMGDHLPAAEGRVLDIFRKEVL